MRLEYHSSPALEQEGGWAVSMLQTRKGRTGEAQTGGVNVPEATQPVESMEPESVQAPEFWPLLSAPLIKVT